MKGQAAATGTLGSRFPGPKDSPGLALWQVAMLWQQRMRAVLAPLELTHAQFVLLASATWLGRAGAPVTQAQIAGLARTDPVMTSEVLRALEKRRLLQRRRHPDDRRARSVVITPAGRDLVHRAVPLVEAEDAAFFDDPGPELGTLAALLAGRRTHGV